MDWHGHPLEGGVLVLRLADACKLGYPEKHVFALDMEGRIPEGATLHANDEIDPAYSCYIATVYDRDGEVVYGPEPWWIHGESPIECRKVAVSIPGFGGAYCAWSDENHVSEGSEGWTPEG